MVQGGADARVVESVMNGPIESSRQLASLCIHETHVNGSRKFRTAFAFASLYSTRLEWVLHLIHTRFEPGDQHHADF